MAAGWRTVRVFISSTFRDMQAERDHLVRFVFPRLREELLRRRIHLVDVDLRWGVTAEQDALSVCREIIDECRPRFICILGGRYGWTPPGEERSITADEIHYAALDRLDREEYRYFYFRDPEATASIPEDAARAGAYREFATEEDIEEYGPERAEKLARERTRKLEALKQQVRDAHLPVFDYPARWDEGRQRVVGLEAFGEAVYRDLLASIDDEFGAETPEPLDWFAEENAAMEAFIEERTERYVVGSRQALLDEMTAHAEGSGEPSVLVVSGEPGSGKSALLGRFCRDYAAAHPTEIVIPHFVGASQGSTSIRLTLRRLCHELAQAAGIEEEIPEDIRELVQAFPEFLERAAERGRVVLIIDALNQLDATDNAHWLNWLPRQLPEGARVICSSLEHPALEALRRRTTQVREVVCAPLTEADGAAIMNGVLARYRKRFDDAQRQALLVKQDSGNPLYLLAALEELRTLGTYELITARIAELPGTVTDLFDWILTRLAEGIEGQEAFGEDLVAAYTSYIAVGRGGMTEDELAVLCAPVDAEGEFWVLHRMLRPYLMRRGELVDYFHGQLREAVERRYLPDETTRQQRHRQIAEHLQSRGYGHRRSLSELPYHLACAAMWNELDGPLTDLDFIERKCAAGMTYELVGDYTRAHAGRGVPGPPIRTAWRHERRLGVWCPFCLAWSAVNPTDLGKTLPCPDCAHLLRLNAFAVDAEWHPGGRRIDPPGDRRAGTALVSQALHEFADFVRAQAHVLAMIPELAVQQALNQPDCAAPAMRAHALPAQRIGTWVRWLSKAQQLDPCLATLVGHQRQLSACDVSPDGRLIASVGDLPGFGLAGPLPETGELRLWDAASGAALLTIEAHTWRLTDCMFSPDGRAILAIGGGQASVWDVVSGRQLYRLAPAPEPASGACFSPDGSLVALISLGSLQLYDALTGALLATITDPDIGGGFCRFSPDGSRILADCQDDRARVWLATGGSAEAVIGSPGAQVTDVCFSPRGDAIAVASSDATVSLWDLGGRERATLLSLGSFVFAASRVRFSPDGERVVCASLSSEGAGAWSASDGRKLMDFPGHTLSVTACSFTPDGRRVVSGSQDRALKVWEVATGPGAIDESISPANGCSFSPDGTRIAACTRSGALRLCDADSGVEQMRQEGGTWQNACCFSPDGRTIATAEGFRASFAGALSLWDAASGTCLLSVSDEITNTCAFSPDGRRIVSGHGSFGWGNAIPDEPLAFAVRIWDAEGPPIALQGHRAPVLCCDFSADGQRIVSGSFDGSVKVWDAQEGRELLTVAGLGPSCRFSPDGSSIVSAAGPEGGVRLWDAESGEELRTLTCGDTIPVTDCRFSPDGRYIIACGGTSGHAGWLWVWDEHDTRPICVFPRHGRALAGLAASCDGRTLAVIDETELLYRLRLEGFEVGPPTLVAARLWYRDGIPEQQRILPGHWDDRLTVMCPCHRERIAVAEKMLGQEVPCPVCGQVLRLTPFACDGAARERKPRWRFW